MINRLLQKTAPN